MVHAVFGEATTSLLTAQEQVKAAELSASSKPGGRGGGPIVPAETLTVCPFCFPWAGGRCGQAHESLHQHDREETLQRVTLREQPGQLQVKAGGSRRVFSVRMGHPLASAG